MNHWNQSSRCALICGGLPYRESQHDCVGFLMHRMSNQSEKPMMCQDPSPNALNFPLVENDPPPTSKISTHQRKAFSVFLCSVTLDHY